MQKEAFLKPASSDQILLCENEIIPKIYYNGWADFAITLPE